MFRGSPNRKPTIARKVVSLLVLGCLLLASTPLPMGFKVVQRSDSTPFPCMDCACGCATPEQCWTACCCFTPAERERWAEQHGVAPPSYAVLSNSSIGISTVRESALCESTQAACGSSLCTKLHKEACENCSSHVCDMLPEVMSDEVATCADSADQHCADSSQVVTVISVVALRCKGASSEFTMLPWAIVESGTNDVISPEVVVDPYLVFSEAAASLGIAPATPPPKC